MILDDVGVTKKIWSDYILVTFWLHIMVYGYTESDVIAESRGWNAMSGDNDVVCVLWICVVVGTESYVCDQLPKLPEEPPPIGDCADPESSVRDTIGCCADDVIDGRRWSLGGRP
jgi:hypothetical protein